MFVEEPQTRAEQSNSEILSTVRLLSLSVIYTIEEKITECSLVKEYDIFFSIFCSPDWQDAKNARSCLAKRSAFTFSWFFYVDNNFFSFFEFSFFPTVCVRTCIVIF